MAAQKVKTATAGDEHEERFAKAVRRFRHAPVAGARDLPVLSGLHPPPKAIFTDPQETVLLKAADHLATSGRVYTHGNSIVVDAESYDGAGRQLCTLAIGGHAEAGAESALANLLTCCAGDCLFPPPGWFTRLLLKADPLRPRLPRVRHYATRPVFDRHFVLRGPGWHPEEGILVHGDAVEPDEYVPPDPSLPAVERLPPRLRTLLGGFCFRTDADAANALGMFVHGFLANHFATDQRPIWLADGNQPGLGKSLLVRLVGVILDGAEPALIPWLNNDEELQKSVCAHLRGGRSSVVLIDNAGSESGTPIKSPILEGYVSAPLLEFRILGQSAIYSRPNTVTWALTMNGTRISLDLTSRGVPIRLHFEGQPEARKFAVASPVEFARAHRGELLAELAGMIAAWANAGRPPGQQNHRCSEWAAVVGVMTCAGFPEFLSNYGEAAISFNNLLDDLSALAEAVVKGNGPFVEVNSFEEVE